MNARLVALLVAAGPSLLAGCSSPSEGLDAAGRGATAGGPSSGGSGSAPGPVVGNGGTSGSDDSGGPAPSTPDGSGNAPPAESVPSNPSSACGSDAGITPGRSEITIESGGVTRRLLVYVPAGHARDEALPLVFNFHGSGLTPEIQLETSGLVPYADAKGFVMVAPTGLAQTWNIPPDASEPDDVQMVADALDEVEARVCVDRNRVFAAGFSGGGRMSSQLGCDLSSRIAAVAVAGGVRFPGPCSGRAFPVLAFHGTADAVNPYDGGGQAFWQTGVEDAIAGWAGHNGCGARGVERVAAGVDRIGYAGCVEVALYRIEGFEHEWPRAITPDASADDLIWSFFERHPLVR